MHFQAARLNELYRNNYDVIVVRTVPYGVEFERIVGRQFDVASSKHWQIL